MESCQQPARSPDATVVSDLEELYGPFASRHHARYHDARIPYHVVIRAVQGFALFTPTEVLNALIAGVIGRAQTVYPSVRLYAFAFLSNHAHLMLQGASHELPAFIAYLKREVSRRHAWAIDWCDAMWSAGYLSTALPTPESHDRCHEYIVSQGCKEDLVERPDEWPGLHVAKQLLTGEPLVGTWLNGTRYGKARWKERQKPEDKRRSLECADFCETYRVELTPLPRLRDCSDTERRAQAANVITRVAERARIARNGRPVLGVEGVLAVPRMTRWSLPVLPWFEERRRMIAWASPVASETKQYRQAYWAFQTAFRAASDDYLAGNANAEFPPAAFRPSVFAARVRPPGTAVAA